MPGDNNEAHNNTVINCEGLRGWEDETCILSTVHQPPTTVRVRVRACVRVYDVTRNKPVTQFSPAQPTRASESGKRVHQMLQEFRQHMLRVFFIICP